MRQLRFIARIRTIHRSIVTCALSLPGFGDIEVHCVQDDGPHTLTRSKIKEGRQAALGSLIEYLGNVPAWFRDPRVKARIENELCRRPLVVHAEMQMALFFDTHKELKPFPYIGTSKKTCYLCNNFLSELGIFGTRGSHYQLHPHWTLPLGFQISEQRFYHSPSMALKMVTQRLAEMIGRSNVVKLALLPESTAVWSGSRAVSSRAISVVSSRPSRQAQNRAVEGTSRSSISAALQMASGAQKMAPPGLRPSQSILPNNVTAATKGEDSSEATKLKLDFLVGILKVRSSQRQMLIKSASNKI